MTRRAIASFGLATAALLLAAAHLLGASSCAPFGEANGGALDAGLGDVVVEPPRPRDVRVQVSWPTAAALDPGKDARATKMRVAVVDAVDASRRVDKPLDSVEVGPFEFQQFVTTNVVDVTVEIRGMDDRLVGYGERRRYNLAESATVPVAARRRLLYFTSADRDDGQLRALGMTPASMAEPKMDEPHLPPLTSLRAPSGLYISSDGTLLVQAGRAQLADGGPGAGAIAVIETASHATSRTVSLPFGCARVAPLGDGHRLLAAPCSSDDGVTTFALVDVDRGVSTVLSAGLAGGGVDVESISVSPDGSRVAAVGSYVESRQARPYLFDYEDGAPTVKSRELSALLESASGVRFSPDGKRLVIAGANPASGWSTGALLVFDVGPSGISGDPIKTITLAAGKTRPSSLVLHPDGKHAYVSHDINYGTSTCCAEMRIVDLEAGAEVFASDFPASGPEFDLLTAVRLPYAPYRVLGGQSDSGNNVHGPVVEMTQGGAKPVGVDISGAGDIGSIEEMATPFGTRL